jgi:hypothetical protein
LVDAQSGSLLRVRLEWRQTTGMTLVNLEPQGRLQGDAGLWARTLAATIRTQMLVPVQASADAEDALAGGDLSGPLPVSGLFAPGSLRFHVTARGRKARQVDTTLTIGRPVQLDLKLLPHPVAVPPVAKRRRSNLHRFAYGLGGAVAGGAAWFAWSQQQAQERYRDLDQNAAPGQFSSRWSDVRQANLWRNGLAGLSLTTLGIGFALQLGEASFSW